MDISKIWLQVDGAHWCTNWFAPKLSEHAASQARAGCAFSRLTQIVTTRSEEAVADAMDSTLADSGKERYYASLFDLLDGVDAQTLLSSGPLADGSANKQLRDIFRGAEGERARERERDDKAADAANAAAAAASESRVLRPANQVPRLQLKHK